MIFAGLEIANALAGAELRALAERLRCPVADTPQIKGWFPASHPLYAGAYATHRNTEVVDLAQRSDLILALGLDSVEFLRPWQIRTRVVSVRGEGEDERVGVASSRSGASAVVAPSSDEIASSSGSSDLVATQRLPQDAQRTSRPLAPTRPSSTK